MNKELLPDELEAMRITQWIQEIADLIDLSYGCYDLSQGSTQAWWESINAEPF